MCYESPRDTPDWQDDVDQRILWAMDQAREMGYFFFLFSSKKKKKRKKEKENFQFKLIISLHRLVESGMTVIAIQGWKQGVGYTNTMRMLTVPH